MASNITGVSDMDAVQHDAVDNHTTAAAAAATLVVIFNRVGGRHIYM